MSKIIQEKGELKGGKMISFFLKMCYVHLCFPGGSDGKESTCNAGDPGWMLQNHCRCNCSHEIKRHLLYGRKAMTNLDRVLKSRDIMTQVRIVKAMVFPVVWMSELDHKES